MNNPAKRVIRRIREYLSTSSDALMTSYRTFTRRWYSIWQPPINNWNRSDYPFWRKAYFCQAKGLELSGLFIKPLCSKIAAWVLGRAPKWRCDDLTSQEALEQWWNEVHPDILQAYRSSKKQGDAFLVINSDLSVTLLAPDCVDPIVAEDDYSHIIGWRVTQTLANPGTADRMTTIDEYYVDRRIHRVQINSTDRSVETYPNLIGMLPIVLIANNADVGQTFGHAEAEALLPTFHRYGEVMDAAIEGNILQGRPTPVITFGTVQDENKFWALYGSKQTAQLPDGSSQSVETLNVDLSQILTITNGSFDFKSPGNFSADVVNILEILFYLILEYTEIPEFVMGNAISSSKASAETQMPVFERFIEGQQSDAKDWLTAVSTIALAYLSLVEPGVVAQTPSLQWRKLTQDGRLMLDTIVWAVQAGLLDRRTALMLSPLEVEDIDAVLAAVDAEKAQARPAQLPPSAPQDEQEEEQPVVGEYADPEKAAIVQAAASILTEVSLNGHA
jgi:hypothetical protein